VEDEQPIVIYSHTLSISLAHRQVNPSKGGGGDLRGQRLPWNMSVSPPVENK
jgi:hypothetical protein